MQLLSHEEINKVFRGTNIPGSFMVILYTLKLNPFFIVKQVKRVKRFDEIFREITRPYTSVDTVKETNL
jgi:hypothetical protein